MATAFCAVFFAPATTPLRQNRMLKSLPLTPVFSSFAFPKTFLRTLQPCLRMLQASRILPGWIRAGSCGIRSCSGSALRPSIEADLDRAHRFDNGAVLTTRFGGIAVFAALAKKRCGRNGQRGSEPLQRPPLGFRFFIALRNRERCAKAGAHARF